MSGTSQSGWLYCQKIDNSGNVIWSRDYTGDSLVNTINGQKITRSYNNCFALGTSNGINLGRLLEIDSLGNIINSKFYNYPQNIGIYQYNINFTSDSGYIISGGYQTYLARNLNSDHILNKFHNNSGDKLIDILVFKIDKFGNTVWINSNDSDLNEFVDINIFPNPYNLSFQINLKLISKSKTKLNLYDVSGKLVKSIENKTLNIGTNIYKVHTPELSSGIYFLNILINKESYTKKILLIK